MFVFRILEAQRLQGRESNNSYEILGKNAAERDSGRVGKKAGSCLFVQL